jgi:hypothetical protein
MVGVSVTGHKVDEEVDHGQWWVARCCWPSAHVGRVELVRREYVGGESAARTPAVLAKGHLSAVDFIEPRQRQHLHKII